MSIEVYFRSPSATRIGGGQWHQEAGRRPSISRFIEYVIIWWAPVFQHPLLHAKGCLLHPPCSAFNDIRFRVVFLKKIGWQEKNPTTAGRKKYQLCYCLQFLLQIYDSWLCDKDYISSYVFSFFFACIAFVVLAQFTYRLCCCMC